MRLRQICLVSPDLDQAVDQIQQVLGLGRGYRDEGVSFWGLDNMVMPLGYDFLEIVSPRHEDTAAARYLVKRGGAGGYMVILQAEEGLVHRKRLTERGIRTVFTADRDPDIWISQYHPADCGNVFLEIDSVNPVYDHLAPDCPWPPAGQTWLEAVNTDIAQGFLAVNLQNEDPRGMALLWSDLLDQPVFDHESRWSLKLQNALIRFVGLQDERGPGIESLDILVNDLDAALDAAEAMNLRTGESQVELVGTRMNLLPGSNL